MDNDTLRELDRSVRRRPLKPRAVKEEEGFGISDKPPTRRPGESDSYWYIRWLTFNIVRASYRIPQMNMYLLEDYLNDHRGGKYFITRSSYVAPGENNMRFTTAAGRIDFFARQEIDPAYFLSKFGLSFGGGV